MKFLRRLCRNGNSLTVTIPPQVIDRMRLRGRDPLILEMLDLDTLTIRRPKSLDDMYADPAPMTLNASTPVVR